MESMSLGLLITYYQYRAVLINNELESQTTRKLDQILTGEHIRNVLLPKLKIPGYYNMHQLTVRYAIIFWLMTILIYN